MRHMITTMKKMTIKPQSIERIEDIMFIHHGEKPYCKALINPVKNETLPDGRLGFDKPYDGGFWATIYNPNMRDEWELFCLEELNRPDRLKYNVKFTLKPSSKVYVIHTPEDVFALPGRFRFDRKKITDSERDFMGKYIRNFYDQYYLDFEAIAEEYDAILVYMSNDINHILYSWDVSTLLVFNPDIIETI